MGLYGMVLTAGSKLIAWVGCFWEFSSTNFYCENGKYADEGGLAGAGHPDSDDA